MDRRPLSRPGISNPLLAHPRLGQDVILLASSGPPASRAWKEGLDEFGRIWSKGFYREGALKNVADLKRFSPPAGYAREFFSDRAVSLVKESYPDHFPFFGTHSGPFMSTYMAMGMETMFCSLYEDLAFVEAVMETRAEWCLALFKEAVRLGAELIVMGDDAAHIQVLIGESSELILAFLSKTVRQDIGAAQNC
jgi:hypothetical protein